MALLNALLAVHPRPTDASRALGLKDGAVALWVHRGGVPYPKRTRVRRYLNLVDMSKSVDPARRVLNGLALPDSTGWLMAFVRQHAGFEEIFRKVRDVYLARDKYPGDWNELAKAIEFYSTRVTTAEDFRSDQTRRQEALREQAQRVVNLSRKARRKLRDPGDQ